MIHSSGRVIWSSCRTNIVCGNLLTLKSLTLPHGSIAITYCDESDVTDVVYLQDYYGFVVIYWYWIGWPSHRVLYSQPTGQRVIWVACRTNVVCGNQLVLKWLTLPQGVVFIACKTPITNTIMVLLFIISQYWDGWPSPRMLSHLSYICVLLLVN